MTIRIAIAALGAVLLLPPSVIAQCGLVGRK
jgi:hypothetical protein